MDINKFFLENNFTESLILEFVYNAEAKTVKITCDYAYNVLMAILQGKSTPLTFEGSVYHRDFRQLIFQGVKFYRRSGIHGQLLPFANNFSAERITRSVVIQHLEVKQTAKPGHFRIRIGFGDFGRCSFEFSSIQADRKLGEGTPKLDNPEEWEYREIKTSAPFSFYHPFDHNNNFPKM